MNDLEKSWKYDCWNYHRGGIVLKLLTGTIGGIVMQLILWCN